MVDVDWYVEAPHAKSRSLVDGEKAAAAVARRGGGVAQVTQTLALALGEAPAGLLHDRTRARGRADRDAPRRVAAFAARGACSRSDRRGARPVPLGDRHGATHDAAKRSAYHKNLQPVTYVTADLGGVNESPVYAILADERRDRHGCAARGLRHSSSSTPSSRSTLDATR